MPELQKASEFETEIRAEMHNLSLLSNPDERVAYIQTIISKLLPYIYSKDDKAADEFTTQVRMAYNRNMNPTNIEIDGEHGIRIEDQTSGVQVKVKYRDMGKGYDLFMKSQDKYIAAKLQLALDKILAWFYREKLFDINNSSREDVYQTFLMKNRPDKIEDGKKE